MTTAPDVAVVATQLAQTDRRALSQAWYSALHLTHDAPALAGVRRAAPATRATMRMPRVRGAAERASAPHTAAYSPQRAVRALAPALAASERRSAPTDAMRRLERAVATIAREPHARTSQTIAIDGGRVTVLVRTGAGGTRVVALCREPLRAVVERALAHVRFTLAARGDAVPAR